MNKKILGNVFKVLVIVLILAAFTGCDDLFSTITMKVHNYQFWGVNVDYRASGDTEWQTGVSYVSEDTEKYFDLPSPGDYDFRIRDWVSSGDYINEIILAEDCSFEMDVEYDYIISVTSTSVSIY